MNQIIHRLWLGPDPMPQKYREFGALWEDAAPGWEVKLWHPGNLPDLYWPGIWEEIGKRPASSIPMDPWRAASVQRSDIIHYQLIHQFGGICLNVDIEPLRPIEDLIGVVGNNAWASYEDQTYLVNCAYGGPQGHPFWQALVDELPRHYEMHKTEAMQYSTGPHLLTKIWKSVDWGGDFVALPTTAFNFVYHWDIPAGGNADAWKEEAISAGAFGLHHWSHREDQGKYL